MKKHRMDPYAIRVLLILKAIRLLTLILVAGTVRSAEPTMQFQPLAAENSQVPQTVLNLIHTAEVQKELRMEGAALAGFLPRLQELDGPWIRAMRLQPVPELRKVAAQQESLLVAELAKRFGPKSVTRLRQLELQSQGYRILLRPELIDYLKITPEQARIHQDLFAETDALAAKASSVTGDAATAAQKQWQTARENELKKAHESLTAEQQVRLRKALGDLVETSKFERIYPLVPELIEAGNPWVGDKKVTLKGLRGKVVLVHFYAFQCHNCIANFKIYNRWRENLQSKGVQVVGIQTPETAAEGDPAKVSSAALKDQFQFPVLIDLNRKNWDAWANTMWPTVYVIDKQGYLRYYWMGELNWQGATVDQTIEKLVDRLLAEK